MIVDENASATATYNATVADMPSSSARPNPMMGVNATCPRTMIRATLPVVRGGHDCLLGGRAAATGAVHGRWGRFGAELVPDAGNRSAVNCGGGTPLER
jgi:hypothetical protein